MRRAGDDLSRHHESMADTAEDADSVRSLTCHGGQAFAVLIERAACAKWARNIQSTLGVYYLTITEYVAKSNTETPKRRKSKIEWGGGARADAGGFIRRAVERSWQRLAALLFREEGTASSFVSYPPPAFRDNQQGTFAFPLTVLYLRLRGRDAARAEAGWRGELRREMSRVSADQGQAGGKEGREEVEEIGDCP